MPNTMPNIDLLLNELVEPLVSHPEAMEIRIKAGDEFLEYHVYLHPDDVGRVIGKHGRVANAIRTILYSVRVEGHRRIRLSFDRIED